MFKLEGKSLSVNVPVSTLKTIGDQYQIPAFDDYANTIINMLEEKGIVEDARFDSFMEFQPYFSNFAFLSPIIQKMVVSNITFSQALEASQDEIEETRGAIGFFMLMIKITGIEEMLNQLIVELIESVFEDLTEISGSNDSKERTIPVTLDKLNQGTLYSLINYGLYDIAEKASQNPEIRSIMHNKMVNPIIESVLKVSDEEDGIMTNMTPEDKKDLQEAVTECQNDSTIVFPLQTILSTVLTKAISDDTTISQAASTFTSDELMEKVVKAIHDAPDMNKYQGFIEKITKLIS